ncbi:hypothetical protein, partial [Catenulispora rubra]|uniref:hypothetical protein n=1 Tax=Catenulispora rubra TaxID=280293 RepID=UPI0018925491
MTRIPRGTGVTCAALLSTALALATATPPAIATAANAAAAAATSAGVTPAAESMPQTALTWGTCPT